MRFRLAAFADEAASSLEGQIAAMKENGVELLEIRGVDGENIAYISAEKAREIRKRLDEENLGVWSLGSPFGKIGIGDDFEEHIDKFRRSLDTAYILGAKHIRVFSFYGSKKFDEVAPKVERFLDAAKGSGIMLCHENEKGIYGDTADRCLRLHKEFPDLKAVFDPANYIQCGEDTLNAWKLISPYVEYMHIKDALPDGSVVPAGKGAGNLPFLISEYKGDVLTVEPHLSVFEGFSGLEAKEKSRTEFVYPDSRTAFDAAVNTLKNIIESAC